MYNTNFFTYSAHSERSVLCLVAQLCLTLATPWTVAGQAPLSMGILQARILEWVTFLQGVFLT